MGIIPTYLINVFIIAVLFTQNDIDRKRHTIHDAGIGLACVMTSLMPNNIIETGKTKSIFFSPDTVVDILQHRT